jgi:hypothetical protein
MGPEIPYFCVIFFLLWNFAIQNIFIKLYSYLESYFIGILGREMLTKGVCLL